MAATTKGFTAVMAQRREPPNALDFFPTPLWATRALFRYVLPVLGIEEIGRVWEPACGAGHMTAVIAEFTREPVIASDIFDYGCGAELIDFLDERQTFGDRADWIVTNPPFKPAGRFALRALYLARTGVALLLRTQWLESEDRYHSIFHDRPPTLFAPFVERVPMLRGRCDPDASTATSYSWFVWVHGMAPRPPFWIPPGCRASLTRPDDRRRFASHASDAPLFSPCPLMIESNTSNEADRG
jgi:hypothetical protein